MKQTWVLVTAQNMHEYLSSLQEQMELVAQTWGIDADPRRLAVQELAKIGLPEHGLWLRVESGLVSGIFSGDAFIEPSGVGSFAIRWVYAPGCHHEDLWELARTTGAQAVICEFPAGRPALESVLQAEGFEPHSVVYRVPMKEAD